MAIGTITIGETPCCGVIERTYEAYPTASSTGMWHVPGAFGAKEDHPNGGPYAPTFSNLARQINQGYCPDCGQLFHPAKY